MRVSKSDRIRMSAEAIQKDLRMAELKLKTGRVAEALGYIKNSIGLAEGISNDTSS